MEEDAPDAKAIAKRISVLARDVHSPDVERRRASAQEIYDLCYKAPDLAKSALPALMDFLCDSDEKVGDSALWGLKYCAPDSIEPLIECLAHRDAKVRERASHSLGNIGDEAITAGDALRGLLDDPTPACSTSPARRSPTNAAPRFTRWATSGRRSSTRTCCGLIKAKCWRRSRMTMRTCAGRPGSCSSRSTSSPRGTSS